MVSAVIESGKLVAELEKLRDFFHQSLGKADTAVHHSKVQQGLPLEVPSLQQLVAR